MLTLILMLKPSADQAVAKLSFDERLGEEDCFVSCERTFSRKWRLTYKLNQLSQQQIDWLLYHLHEGGDLLAGEIEAAEASGVDSQWADLFAIGGYAPFTIKFHR